MSRSLFIQFGRISLIYVNKNPGANTNVMFTPSVSWHVHQNVHMSCRKENKRFTVTPLKTPALVNSVTALKHSRCELVFLLIVLYFIPGLTQLKKKQLTVSVIKFTSIIFEAVF